MVYLLENNTKTNVRRGPIEYGCGFASFRTGTNRIDIRLSMRGNFYRDGDIVYILFFLLLYFTDRPIRLIIIIIAAMYLGKLNCKYLSGRGGGDKMVIDENESVMPPGSFIYIMDNF